MDIVDNNKYMCWTVIHRNVKISACNLVEPLWKFINDISYLSRDEPSTTYLCKFCIS